MPAAFQSACAGCGQPTIARPCVSCRKAKDTRRGTSAERGYGRRWQARRRWFFGRLVGLGIAPVCGARLPGALSTADSLCASEGLLNGDSLDVDHIEPHDGQDDPKFWDPLNWQALCHRRCHPRKTATKDGGFGR